MGIRLPLLLCLAVGLTPACADRSAPLADLPAGAFVAGDARALERLLEGLAGLAGTPLARTAREWRDRLSSCQSFAAAAPRPDPEELLAALRCDPEALPESVTRLRAGGDVAVVLPLGADGRFAARLEVADSGGVGMRARLALPEQGRAFTWLLPSAGSPAGPAVLSTRAALVHARARPADGLPIASLVAQGSQADRLFRLRSELFAGAVLDGRWEVAAYLPEPGQLVPAIAAALGVRSRTVAVAALEEFVGELESTWPVHRSPFALDGHEGLCLRDLRVLPELAPCAVATDDHLIVGWNAESVRVALSPGSGPGPDPAGGWIVHLDRLPKADERLRQAAAPYAPPVGFEYGWQRLVIRPVPAPQDGTLTLEAELVRGAAS